LRSYPNLGPREVPNSELLDTATCVCQAHDDPRRSAAVRVGDIVQAHDERGGVLGQRDSANLSYVSGVEEQDLSRPSISIADQSAQSGKDD